MAKMNPFFGIFLVVMMALFNVAAEQTSRSIVIGFDAPFFMQYFSTSWVSVCFIIYTIIKIIQNLILSEKWNFELVPDLKPLGITGGYSVWQLRYCFLFMCIYMGCNTLYVEGLKFLPNTIASSIMALDPAVVFCLSFCCLNNFSIGVVKNILQLAASALAISGTVLFILDASSSDEDSNESEDDFDINVEIIGIMMICASVILSSLYKILFGKLLGNLNFGQVMYLLSSIGVLEVLLLWPVVITLFKTGVEDLSGEIPWNALCFSAALGLGFNFFLNFGVAYTYPLYMSVGQALVAPLNLLVDLIWREEEFSTYQIIGSCLSIAAFSTLLIPLKQKENIEDEDKNETTL